MRRKRLQHAADILCHMFCGWRLMNAYPDLEQRGSGTLHIEVLTEACTFNGQPIPSLSIAGELGAWLHRDVAAHKIEVSALREVALVAELQMRRIPRKQRHTHGVHFNTQGHHLAPPEFVACAIYCRSWIITDEKTYTSEYQDLEEWPSGWPRA